MIATMEQPSMEDKSGGTFHPAQSPSSSLNTPSSRKRSVSPARSTASTLTDIGTSTPVGGNSPAPAFALNNAPPAKKRKLTFAEQEEQRILKQIQKAEKAEEKARRESEKKQREFEKAKRDAEREEKRLIREAEKAEKEKEKATKAEEKRKKDDEKRKKEEEKSKVDEERRKKEQKQIKLNAFFTQKPTSATETASPEKPARDTDKRSQYERAFPAFFIKEHVRLAKNHFQLERWGSADPVEKEIDDYLSGQKVLENDRKFDASYLFNCPDLCVMARGKKIIPIRDIMAQVYGGASEPIDLTKDSQKTQFSHTRDLLRQVPYKVFKFYEDVRPQYNGTNTSQPTSTLMQLARHPLKRDLPSVNYGYDSEAEWVDEADDGEDVDSDADDDEDEIEEEEDADGFLDDTDDQGAHIKNAMQGDLEPVSTGLVWEDEIRQVSLPQMYGYRMEVLNENVPINKSINPFSPIYWQDPTPSSASSMDPPRVPLNAMKSTSSIINGPRDLKMFGITSSQKQSGNTPANKTAKKLIADEDMVAFRKEVQGNQLSKVGLIEVLHKKLNKSSKAAIKFTIENLAKRVGTKEAEKKWILIDDTTT